MDSNSHHTVNDHGKEDHPDHLLATEQPELSCLLSSMNNKKTRERKREEYYIEKKSKLLKNMEK